MLETEASGEFAVQSVLEAMAIARPKVPRGPPANAFL
jgi:hypothetical protein